MDNYEDAVKIGEGTYGVVYRAKSKSTGKLVAIKKIRVETINEGVPSTAIREVSVLKEFRHQNIVQLLEVIYEERKRLYLVFENMQEDLKTFLEKNKVDNEEALKFLKQILSGTAYCHGHRILHRDIKPQNILINANHDVKLADFGLARCFGIPLRPYTHEVVTLWYRAPEILLKNEYYSTSVDVWSIGCIYVETLQGKPLFEGDSEIDQLLKIFRVMGTPDRCAWADVENLPYFSDKWPKWQPMSLSTLVPTAPKIGLLLTTRMLVLDPQYRISAREAFNLLDGSP